MNKDVFHNFSPFIKIHCKGTTFFGHMQGVIRKKTPRGRFFSVIQNL